MLTQLKQMENIHSIMEPPAEHHGLELHVARVIWPVFYLRYKG